jgi:hypothetical protein
VTHFLREDEGSSVLRNVAVFKGSRPIKAFLKQTTGEVQNKLLMFVCTCAPEGRRPLGRPRRRWQYGIRMDLEEIGWLGGCGVDSPGSG